MIDLEFLQKLMRALDKSGLDHIEIERGGTRIRVSRSPSPSPIVAPAVPASSSQGPGIHAHPAPAGASSSGAPTPFAEPAPSPAGNLAEIKSPMVGTFFRSPTPESEPFTDVGMRVSKGDPLCIIEAMKLMNELESEIDGTIREVCVENGEPVEYGQVLFRVEPA